MVQWLRIHAPPCRGPKFDPQSGDWIPHVITKSLRTAPKIAYCTKCAYGTFSVCAMAKTWCGQINTY